MFSLRARLSSVAPLVGSAPSSLLRLGRLTAGFRGSSAAGGRSLHSTATIRQDHPATTGIFREPPTPESVPERHRKPLRRVTHAPPFVPRKFRGVVREEMIEKFPELKT